MTQSSPSRPSLLDDLVPPGGPIAPGAAKRQGSLRARLAHLRSALQSDWDRRMASPSTRAKTIKQLRIAGVALALALGTGLYFWLRPVPQPDYRRARLDRVMGYTLLTDEFNRLPVEERLKLIGDLVNRLKNMSSGDSVMLAAFASGIAGSARQQLEENASRVAIDMWDKYAKDYDNVPLEGREQFLEQAFVDMTKTMDVLSGRPSDKSDTDRINEVRQQAQRDRQALRDPNNAPPPEALGRMAVIMNRTLGGNANPAQRVRGAQMMRDMVRVFRGQDVSTGKPK